ncbi:MAG TPA: M1 family aminopeptidase, partial [Candidatus Eremiobacteraceae bacterium]|nr:M1 family aminopeptidase [Candidatus Eremiobacteraceae bacterium]
MPFGGGRAFFHYPRYHEYQLDDVRVKVSFDEVKGIVYGDTTNTLTTIQPQTTFVDFDSAGLRYSRIALPGGFALRYQTFGETLRVFLPSAAPAGTKLAIEAVYSATPNKGLYFVRPDSWYPDRPWEVWSQGEMTDNHSWFPTYDWPDMPATSETIVTVPKGQIVVSNGRLASVTHDAAAGTDTFDWVESAPHSTYLISIVAGTFAQVTDHLGSLPVTYYAPPDLKSTVAFDFRKTPDMIDFFSKFNGVPYPYEKYAQSAVVDFTYGGMENISATTQTSRTLHDRRSELDSDSEGLVAHELAHQWWGDDETMEDWGQMWLNEGYAVYYEALYRGHAHGKDAFDMDRLGMIQAVMAEDVTVRHPVVTETYAEPIDMFDNIGYGKAALVLHMLRTMLGDDVYRKAQTAFLTQYQHKTANTAQWEAAFEASTGQDLHWFVDEWLYQAGFPEYTVSYTYDDVAKVLHLSVAQTQDTAWNTPAVFTMPIDVLVQTPDGSTTNTVIHDDQRQQTFDIPASAQPAMVLFDPGQNVLSTVSFPKSDAELAYQMRHATSVLDRLSAAETIFSINRLTKLEFVGLTPFEAAQARWYLHSEPVADARAQFITTFARWVQSPDARDIVVAELGDQSAHVRLASATALASFPPDAAGTRALRAHAAGDPSYATIAACIRTLAD